VSKFETYLPPASAAKPLSPTELLASLRSALAPWQPGTPFWIFAYGSLMWNPSFSYDARHVATIRGYHRSFRVWSRINRGTPEKPGLVLTLECGGSCRGLIYRIPADLVQEQMNLIWKREMNYGSYRPKWLSCTVGDETIRALAFTVNRQCSGYAGQLPIEAVVEAIARRRLAAEEDVSVNCSLARRSQWRRCCSSAPASCFAASRNCALSILDSEPRV